MPPNFFKPLLLIIEFELTRAFMTTRGLISLLAFAMVWGFILMYPLSFTANLLESEKHFSHGFSVFDLIGFGGLQHWSIAEIDVLWQFNLVLFPSMSIMLAADQTCSDRMRGTLRFILQHASRDSVFFGRFLGVMLIQAGFILLAALSTFGIILARDLGLWSQALPELGLVFINVLFVILPFSALMATLSVWVKSARQATVWAVLIWMFMSGVVNGLAHYLPMLDALKLLIPGYQLTQLAQLAKLPTLQLAYIPLLQTMVLLNLGRWLFMRQAV